MFYTIKTIKNLLLQLKNYTISNMQQVNGTLAYPPACTASGWWWSILVSSRALGPWWARPNTSPGAHPNTSGSVRPSISP